MVNEIWHKGTYLWNRSRFTVIENRLVAAKGRRKGRDGAGVRGWQMQTLTHRMDRQGPTAASSDKPEWKRIWTKYMLLFSCEVMSDSFVTPWTVRLLCPWDSPDKNTGVGCHFLLQGIFPTQGSNSSSPTLQVVSLPLSHEGRKCIHLYN